MAGRWFANLVPELIFAEGGYGKFLLKDDILTKPIRFHFGGRIPVPTGPGLGIEVDPGKLAKYSASEPISIHL